MENLLKKVKNLKRKTRTQILVNQDEFILTINNRDIDKCIYIVGHLLTDEYNKALEEVEYLITSMAYIDTCGCGHAKSSHKTGGMIRYNNSYACLHCPCTMYLSK